MKTFVQLVIFAVVVLVGSLAHMPVHVVFITAHFFAVQSADAARCGGRNQRPCNRRRSPYATGCKPWYYPKNRRCHPCGGRDQVVCRIAGQGNNCRAGLVIKDDTCRKVDCGAERQRVCTPNERVPACDPPLIDISGICLPRI